jgi:hypothetical protein
MTTSGESGHQIVAGGIIAFPLSARTSLIRRCAAELEAVHGEAAVAYWRSACRALADDLARVGSDEDDIHFQVMDFQTEVQLEMMRRYTERLESDTAAEVRVRT